MKLLVSLVTVSCFALSAEEIKIEATGLNPNERHLEATPELIELLVDIDPKAYGYRAQAHKMAINMTLDPLFDGRLSLDYALKLNSHLKLLFPVSFEHTQLMLSQWLLNDRIDSQSAVLGGIGSKLRLSEWMQKSSFFVELWVQSGVYAQKAKGFQDTRYAVALRPSLYAGWERIFESGLVFGAKAGIEYNYHLAVGAPLAYAENRFNIMPAINLGFAW